MAVIFAHRFIRQKCMQLLFKFMQFSYISGTEMKLNQNRLLRTEFKLLRHESPR